MSLIDPVARLIEIYNDKTPIKDVIEKDIVFPKIKQLFLIAFGKEERWLHKNKYAQSIEAYLAYKIFKNIYLIIKSAKDVVD